MGMPSQRNITDGIVKPMPLSILLSRKRTKECMSNKQVTFSAKSIMRCYHTADEPMPQSIMQSHRRMDNAKSTNKRVTFSAKSSMRCFRTSDNSSSASDLYSSSEDYTKYKEDTLKSVRQVISSIENNQDSDLEKSTKLHETATRYYLNSFEELPYILQENGIDPDDAVGVEHLLIGKKMIRMHLALRRNYKRVVLEAQSRQREQGHPEPEQLAEVALHFSRPSSEVAYMKANTFAFI